MSRSAPLQTWLEAYLTEAGAIAGTVHVVEGDALIGRADLNIPPPVIAATARIPIGKGMAGQAWQHQRTFQTCNLQDDGRVPRGARAVSAQAAAAIPVFDDSGEVRAVVGAAFRFEGEIEGDALAALESGAQSLPS